MEESGEAVRPHENGAMVHDDTDELFLPTKAMNTSPVDMEHKGSRAVYGTRTSAYRQNHWNSDEGEDTLHK